VRYRGFESLLLCKKALVNRDLQGLLFFEVDQEVIL
jgi:hypothetical protein